MSNIDERRTWALENHLCRHCGGRILRCVKGNGMTGGGNPVYKCADCGKAGASMGPGNLCWCGFHHRNQHHLSAYTCVPFSILQMPEKSAEEVRRLRQAFLACGCDPSRGEVGVILSRDLYPPIPETETKP